MKKLVALILALSLVFSMCGCGTETPKVSDVAIDELGKAVGSTFSKKSENDNLIFSDNNAGCDISGEADKDEHIFNVKIILTDADVKFIKEQKSPSDIVYNLQNYTKLKLPQLRSTMFLLLADQTISRLSYGKTSISKNDTKGKQIVIDAFNSEVTENGWKYAIALDNNAGTATFTATYIGY